MIENYVMVEQGRIVHRSGLRNEKKKKKKKMILYGLNIFV